MKLAFVLSFMFCCVILALAGKKEPPKWKGLYWVLKDIQRSVDLIHVVEKSAFVGEDGFFVAKMEAMINTKGYNDRRPIGAKKSRVALMTFSSADTRVTEFHLGDYNTFQENSEAILSVPFNDDVGYNVALGEALFEAADVILKNEDDDYPPKNKYRIWLYCSGHDNDGLHLATSWANVLKDSFKAKIYVSAIGPNPNGTWLQQNIASDRGFFRFESLKSYQQAMQRAMRKIRKESKRKSNRKAARKARRKMRND